MAIRPSRPYRTPGIVFESPTSTYAQAVKARSVREPLDSDGIAFLAQLAGKVSMAGIAEQCPHIVNKLAVYRYDPTKMLRAIDGLLIDDRPDRQGFAFTVLGELTNLRELYGRFLK